MPIEAGLKRHLRHRPPPPPPKKVNPPRSERSAPVTSAAPSASPTSPNGAPPERTTPSPTAETARVAQLRHAADNHVPTLQADLLRRLPEADTRPPPVAPAAGHASEPGAFESVDAHPDLVEARRAYETLSDGDELEARLEEDPVLSDWSDIELHALAAVSIDHPEHDELITEAVQGTIVEADTLEDIPENAGFQFLMERHVFERPDRSIDAYSEGLLGDLVEGRLQTEFEEATEGARGDGEFDEALVDYSERTQDLVADYPVLFPQIERKFTGVLDNNAEEIQDIRRADDPWYADINHAITGGVRGAAGWVANELFPLPPPGSGGRAFPGVPGADFINSAQGQALIDLGIGAGISGRGLIEGPAQLVTDPVGTAEAVVQAVRDPSLLLEGYRQTAEEYGPTAALGNVGFDLLIGITTANAAGPGPVATAGRANRLLDFPGGNRVLRAIDRDYRVADDIRNIDGFDGLDRSVQELAVTGALRLDGGPQFVTDVIDSSGFRALSTADQDRLLRMTTSQDPYVGITGRRELQRLLDSDSFQGLPNGNQAIELRRFLNEQPGTPHSPLAAEGTFRPLTDFELGQPELSSIDFSNGGGDIANRHVLTVDGREIEVFSAASGDPNLDRVAEAIASLPPEARARVNRVILEPEADPYDAVMSERRGQELVTNMTASPEGVIRVYPNTRNSTFDQFTDVLAHETGHLVSFDELGPLRFDPADLNNGGTGLVYDGPEWDRWREAADSDGIRGSQYAAADIGEDFAETYRLYVSSRGTPHALELRALMPERFAFLDELTQGI